MVQISNHMFRVEILDLIVSKKKKKQNGSVLKNSLNLMEQREGYACSRTSRKADLKTDAFIVRVASSSEGSLKIRRIDVEYAVHSPEAELILSGIICCTSDRPPCRLLAGRAKSIGTD